MLLCISVHHRVGDAPLVGYHDEPLCEPHERALGTATKTAALLAPGHAVTQGLEVPTGEDAPTLRTATVSPSCHIPAPAADHGRRVRAQPGDRGDTARSGRGEGLPFLQRAGGARVLLLPSLRGGVARTLPRVWQAVEPDLAGLSLLREEAGSPHRAEPFPHAGEQPGDDPNVLRHSTSLTAPRFLAPRLCRLHSYAL